MSGARIIFPEFRDEQSDSRYPFADTATLIADSGAQLNRDSFIDAAIYAIGATAPLYISAIDINSSSVTITISDKSGTSVCTTAYTPLDPPESGELALTDKYGRPAGILISERKISVNRWLGTYYAQFSIKRRRICFWRRTSGARARCSRINVNEYRRIYN